jgi:hypothetical protein
MKYKLAAGGGALGTPTFSEAVTEFYMKPSLTVNGQEH